VDYIDNSNTSGNQTGGIVHEVVTVVEWILAIPAVAAIWYGIAFIGLQNSQKVLAQERKRKMKQRRYPARYDEPYDGSEYAPGFVDDDTFFNHL